MKKQIIITGLKLGVIFELFLLAFVNGILFIYVQHVFETISLISICYIFTVALILLILTNLMFVKLIVSYVERESQYIAQQAFIDSVEQLFTALKSQRHEMMTHVQALYGLIVEEHYKEAVQYIQGIFQETVALNEIIVISRPELSALIRAKSGIASNRGVKFEVTIQTDLQDLSIKPHELNIVLGNIIDNAFDAVTGLDSLHKMVSLSMAQTENAYIIRIINEGRIEKAVTGQL